MPNLHPLSICIAWVVLTSGPAYAQDLVLQDLIGQCSHTIITGSQSLQPDQPCTQLRRQMPSFPQSTLKLQAQTELSLLDVLTGQSQRAATELSQAINLSAHTSNHDQRQLVRSMNTLAGIQASNNQVKQAAQTYADAMTLSKRIGYTAGVVENLSAFACLQLQAGDKGRALRYAQKNINYATSLPTGSIGDQDRILSSAYRALSLAANANLRTDLAIESSISAEAFATHAFANQPSASPLVLVRNELAQLYLSNNDFQKALDVAMLSRPLLEQSTISYSKELAAAFAIYIQALTTVDRSEEALAFASAHAHKLEESPDSGQKVKALASTGIFFMQNTGDKPLARSYIVKATITASKVFGPEAQTTTSLASLADSVEMN